jgi:hypothetical protein
MKARWLSLGKQRDMLDKNTFNKISINTEISSEHYCSTGRAGANLRVVVASFWSGSSAYGRKTNTQKSGRTDGEGHHNALGLRELAQGTKRSKVKIQKDIYRRRIKWTLS